jgi:predicted nucleotide-binding protein
MRPRILFQGSYYADRAREDGGASGQLENIDVAKSIARGLGKSLIAAGLDLILTGSKSLDAEVGNAAVEECGRLSINPRERIRTFKYGAGANLQGGFGMILEPANRRGQEVRTFVVQECDAVIALVGGKGTSDCVQKSELAGKPVFPIPVAGGAGKIEWDRLRANRYKQPGGGDLEFLGDQSLDAADLCSQIVSELKRLFARRSLSRQRRIFIVHGHDGDLKNQLARLLQRLDFDPVILAERPEKGQALLGKLNSELADVAFGFVLYTGDDVGAAAGEADKLKARARQNVLFEHGLLLGLLGSERLCVIVKGDVELPSDLVGIVTKMIPAGANIEAIAIELANELEAAGYDVDANKLKKPR